ncbi:DJ-1/PfpI family protein [Oxalobacter vibrioformis]|uniref:DJ-1/PfpI family protein n=1 Tax=Oxalobacter vibrioformis TaxID=933080 RepID=A0A9E9P215_9BURK|nr:DJ-1/PfpI family protein [Oxalobacter vibrioformis]WAW09404.1 DJ-1/PfpI family protein [Oxalobacter vibrioformis]
MMYMKSACCVIPAHNRQAIHGLTDLFGVANRIAAENADTRLPVLRVRHWKLSETDEKVLCCFDSHPGYPEKPVVIVAPPCLGERPEDAVIRPMLNWLRARHARAAILASVCAGAFVLAHSGALDGRTVTTHWCLAEELAGRFPAVRIDADRLVIDDGDIVTAGADGMD